MWTWYVLAPLFLIGAVLAQQSEKQSTQNPCTSKESCHECIQTPTCAWCAQPNFTSFDGTPLYRCNQQNRNLKDLNKSTCEFQYLINPDNEYTKYLDYQLTKARESQEAIQIRPQHVHLKLRINEPFKLPLEFAQAEDYPVDLYYLMDLSKSMEDDKDKLSDLGDLLAETMQNITSNFRLGFGSFVDKVVMPYVSTVPSNLREPCKDCAAPYGYQNVMSLNKDTGRFAGEVRRAAVSGNLDAPEGGFDAIMQAIVCRGQIGWREKARRLLVFSTDAGFHYAGDGKLGGIVKPNDGHCHMSRQGMYTHSTLQDYPSVSQVNIKVKENAINLIFAVTREQINIYEQLKDKVEGASAGMLSNDSSNVVELVKDEYSKITSSVEIKDNATSAVRVTYFSNCLGNENDPPKQTSKCDGLKVGTVVKFEAKIEVISCPANKADWKQKFQIYPVGINESLIVDLEMLCDCKCESPGDIGYEENSAACSYAGTYKCGICACDASHFGRQCECDNNNIRSEKDMDAGCRPDNTTDVLCSNRGSCVCGVCECYPRQVPKEEVTGKFCQCDNYSCDRYNSRLCSEPNGVCDCGQCKCKPEWTGSACECLASNATCIPPGGGPICSGKGECECGECKCIEDKEGRFSGSFCEQCPTCLGRCLEFRDCVQCQVYQTGPLTPEECAKCNFTPITVDVVEANEDKNEVLCTYYDEEDCRYSYVYGYDEPGMIVVRAQEERDCPAQVYILGIVLGVIAAIVLIGLALLLLWKLLTTIHDRREFAKFEKERQMAKWDTGENPIYKQATSTFKNPTYAGK